jgi:3-oxoacyl-[acyl-carrier-protein] synthase-1/3-oxoacyl-[acyl-carrier-protein] synthase II
MKPVEPVAIIGIGCICSAGLVLKECMDFLYQGKRYPAPPVNFPTKLTFPVFEVLGDFFQSSLFKEKNILRTCKLALTATLEAMSNAGCDRDIFKTKRVGACIGTNIGCSMYDESLTNGGGEDNTSFITPMNRFFFSNPTSSIASEFGIAGPLQTVVNACSSGSDALGLGASWIRSGICDLVIAGGADEMYQITYTGFKSLLINDDAPCKPFDANRKGLNLGEGAAIFILASQEVLKEINKNPRGYILGYGSATDAYHHTKTRPDGKGLKLAIKEALETSGTTPSDIAFINAHGTGTLDNDLVESRVLFEMFPEVPFFSTKGYTGHTLGAAGAIEAAFTIACLENGSVPASVGFTTPDPKMPPAYPIQKNSTINGNKGLSETLAFGGNNSVLILSTGEHQP